MTPKTKQTLELAKNLIAHHANGGDWEAQQSQRVIDQINECLAEPVRNCDIYRSRKDAYNGWVKSEFLKDDGMLFVEWVYAPAEGGAE